MQWQKLSNVNPPIDHVIQLWDSVRKEVLFAQRTIGDRIDFGTSFCGGEIIDNVDHLRYTDFKKLNANFYWCLFKQPFE